MAQTSVQDIRNIAFCGHGNAGKTTLADKILTSTGAVKRPASVDDGTSICDFDDEEKHHKHSIESALVHFSHAGKQFNLLDTPGYPDFIGQIARRAGGRGNGGHRHQRPRRPRGSTRGGCFWRRASSGWGG